MHSRTARSRLAAAAAGVRRRRAATLVSRRRPPAGGLRVEISFSAGARAPSRSPAWSTSRSAATTRRTPIEQTIPTGVPLFSKYVEQLQPGAGGHDRRDDRGHPRREPARHSGRRVLGAAVRERLHAFPRADGHTVWLHMDQWEGQNWKRSPGNLYGDPVKMRDRSRVADADQARRRQGDSADRGRRPTPSMVKRIKIQSQILTKWWGQPIFLGATVLLPKDYDEHPDVHYPVNYIQGHFSLGAPGRLRPRRRRSTSCGSRTTRRGSSTSRCSIRRRTTTTRTA